MLHCMRLYVASGYSHGYGNERPKQGGVMGYWSRTLPPVVTRKLAEAFSRHFAAAFIRRYCVC